MECVINIIEGLTNPHLAVQVRLPNMPTDAAFRPLGLTEQTSRSHFLEFHISEYFPAV
jgi:hypothetical protein